MCAVFGLCEDKKKVLSTKEDTPSSIQTLVRTTKKKQKYISIRWKFYISVERLNNGSLPQEMLDPTCTFCLFIIKKLETLLPTNMTEVSCDGKIDKYKTRKFLISAFRIFPCRKLWWSSWRRSVTLFPLATQSNVKILWPNMAKTLSSSSCRLLHLTLYAPCCTCVYSRSKHFQVCLVSLYVKSSQKSLVWSLVATEPSKSSRKPPHLWVWLLPHVGCVEPSSSGSEFHPNWNILLSPVCVFPSPQCHPQGLRNPAAPTWNPHQGIVLHDISLFLHSVKFSSKSTAPSCRRCLDSRWTRHMLVRYKNDVKNNNINNRCYCFFKPKLNKHTFPCRSDLAKGHYWLKKKRGG